MNDKLKQDTKLIFHWLLKNFDEYTDDLHDEQELESGVDQLTFHSSWDSLMHVIDHIEATGFVEDNTVLLRHKCCIINFESNLYFNNVDAQHIEIHGQSKIDSAFKAVVKFIETHNKLKK